ncbi:Uncharacterized protein XB16_2577 [Leptospira santarosai]|uniref:Uncharacterized protein n=1 Tax=Leptospira santarosai TaxID=28183 RepID=A0A2P1QVE9_9LEPT|nr:Uncharacterized protein XB16_2577 [Leptospira santarosai]
MRKNAQFSVVVDRTQSYMTVFGIASVEINRSYLYHAYAFGSKSWKPKGKEKQKVGVSRLKKADSISKNPKRTGFV